MKRKIKKIVSMILVSSMCFSLLASTAFAETSSGESAEVSRISGANRYATSYAIADELKETLNVEKFSTVLVADGMDFPDALAGSYLAAKMDAPILMVDGDKPDKVANLVEYINANLEADGKIYILGGTAAVSDAVDEALEGYDIERLAGKNRYATNLLILEEAGVDDEEILVCTSKNFADSLSASAAGLPILLVDPTNGLNDAQKKFLSSVKGNDICIIGGTAAVGEIYVTELAAYDTDGVERIAGSNRYKTSTLVAERFFDNPEQAVVAYAMNFPDGLCGGPLAASMGAPLILTGADMSKNPSAAQEEAAAKEALSYIESKGIAIGVILGGAAVLSSNTVKALFGVDENASTDDTVYTLVVTQHDAEASPAGEFLNNWAAEVEEASGGRIDIEIYHGGTIAGPKDAIDAVNLGAVDIAWGLHSYFAGQFPVTEVFALPCIDIDSAVEGSEALWNFYNTTDYMDAEYEGFHVLYLHTDSQSPIATVDTKIETIEDFKGMSIYATAGPKVTFVSAMEAQAEACAINELYMNLDKGIFDGCITSWSSINWYNFHEAVSYLLDENVGVSTYFLLMNPDSYAKLPADLQAILDEVSADAGKYTVAWDEEEAAVKEKAAVAEKIYNLSETERANLESAAKETVATWIEYLEDGQEIYDTAMKCIAEAKK